MIQATPWHSIKQPVYHDDDECTEGNNIEPENLRAGDGGRGKCERCSEIQEQTIARRLANRLANG